MDSTIHSKTPLTDLQSETPFELILEPNEITIPIKTPVEINCRLIGGIPPYQDITWLKNSDDDPVTIFPTSATNRVTICFTTLGTFAIYATAADSADHTSSKQLTIKVTRPILKTSIIPSEVTLDIGDTHCLVMNHVGGSTIEDTGWLPANSGYEIQSKTRTKATIKALAEGTYILSGYLSDTETTAIAHGTITITNTYPWTNYFIVILDKIKKVNSRFFDRLINYLDTYKKEELSDSTKRNSLSDLGSESKRRF